MSDWRKTLAKLPASIKGQVPPKPPVKPNNPPTGQSGSKGPEKSGGSKGDK